MYLAYELNTKASCKLCIFQRPIDSSEVLILVGLLANCRLPQRTQGYIPIDQKRNFLGMHLFT